MNRLSIAMCLLWSTTTHAATTLMPLDKFIPQIDKLHESWQMRTHIGMIVPPSLPAGVPIRYTYFKLNDANNYQIFFSNREHCAGNRDCTLATFSAALGQYPSIYYNDTYDELTKRIQLTPDITAYFTPFFTSQDDPHASQIAFRCENVLYTFTWQMKPHGSMQDLLVKLANSVVAAVPECDYHR